MSFPNVRHTYQTLPIRADHNAGSSITKDIPIYKRQNSFLNKRKHDSCSDLSQTDHENQHCSSVSIDKSPETSNNKRKLSEGSIKSVQNLIRRYESVNNLDKTEIDFPDDVFHNVGRIRPPKTDVHLEDKRQIENLGNVSSEASDVHPLKGEIEDLMDEAFTTLQNSHERLQKMFFDSHQEYMKRSLQEMEHLSIINLQINCNNIRDNILPKLDQAVDEFQLMVESDLEDGISDESDEISEKSDNLQETLKTTEGVVDSDYKRLKISIDVVTKQVMHQKMVIAKLKKQIKEMKQNGRKREL